jgi:hypothetical protein
MQDFRNFTGYRYDKERSDLILARAMPMYAHWHQKAYGYDWPEAEVVDPREWFKIQSQGNIGSCFPAGTEVLLSNGATRPIEQVAVGDFVTTVYNGVREVVATMSRQYRGDMLTVTSSYRDIDGVEHSTVVTLTADHQVYIPTIKQFVEASELAVDDPVMVYINGADRPHLGRVASVESQQVKRATVYDIEVRLEHSFFANGLGVHNCQGNALADAVEYCYMLKYGPEIQLSRFWAYVTSQEEDNINGDSGSTLDGGGKAARSRGICLESSFPYPNGYSEGISFYRANKAKLAEEAAKYKLNGEVPITSWADALKWIRTFSGCIQSGWMWNSSCDVIDMKEYRQSSGGGHSTLLCGVVKRNGEDVLLHKNSWGTRWGDNGWNYVYRQAFEQILRGRYNIFVGRSESASPEPQPKPDL